MPTSPTLTVADNADGTGAVATVAGSDTGATNTIYVQSVTGELGTGTWASGGSRTSDGAVDLDLDKGYYWGYCKSSLSGSDAISSFVYFNVTDGADAYLWQCIQAVQARLQALTFDADIPIANNSIVIRKLPLDKNLLTTPEVKSVFYGVQLPCIIVGPSAEIVNPTQGTNYRDDVNYSVLVTVVDADDQEPTLLRNLPEYLKWREQIRRAIHNQYLPGVSNGAYGTIVPQDLPSLAAWKQNYWAMAQIARFKNRETRGLT